MSCHLMILKQTLFFFKIVLEHVDLNLDFQMMPRQPKPYIPGLDKLPSVTKLSLRVWIHSHKNLNPLNFDHIFPNVHTVHLYIKSYNCSLCDLYDFDIDTRMIGYAVKKHQCIGMLLEPFKKCQKLERIVDEYEMKKEYQVYNV